MKNSFLYLYLNYYLTKLSFSLPLSLKEKKVLTKNIKEEIIFYIQENPNCNITDLKMKLGNPVDFLKNYLTKEDLIKVIKKRKINSIITTLILLSFIIFLIIAIYIVVIELGGEIVIT